MGFLCAEQVVLADFDALARRDDFNLDVLSEDPLHDDVEALVGAPDDLQFLADLERILLLVVDVRLDELSLRLLRDGGAVFGSLDDYF